ncbi:MAG TPA: tRNA pseudouridine(55) synthase TruB [Acidimicrobiales bacterium]|nr:tRNA pseudouridine(55) synthase TruB [Acidimicrobiales bacterium]
MTDGLVVIDKPPGWTSHDVVARCRKIFGLKRVGHSGTLDPDATGVLLVGLGRLTRVLRYLTVLPKSYVGEIVLGTATSTLDAAGDVVATFDMSRITAADVERAAATLVGDIEQIPPMVSAVKVGGRRLHEVARAGEEVERAPRPVTVTRFDVRPAAEAGVYTAEVDCSSGTYVRTLAADVGTALGGGAHLRNLRRTAIGSFTLADATPLEAVVAESAIAPASALRDYPSAVIDDDEVIAVSHGRTLTPRFEGPWRVLDAAGDLLAVYEGAAASVVLRPAAQ